MHIVCTNERLAEDLFSLHDRIHTWNPTITEPLRHRKVLHVPTKRETLFHFSEHRFPHGSRTPASAGREQSLGWPLLDINLPPSPYPCCSQNLAPSRFPNCRLQVHSPFLLPDYTARMLLPGPLQHRCPLHSTSQDCRYPRVPLLLQHFCSIQNNGHHFDAPDSLHIHQEQPSLCRSVLPLESPVMDCRIPDKFPDAPLHRGIDSWDWNNDKSLFHRLHDCSYFKYSINPLFATAYVKT